MILTKARLSLGIAGLLLVGATVWDMWVHGQPVRAQTREYDRTKYFTKAPPRPYTFTSRYTLSTPTMDHTIRLEVTEAEDSLGRGAYIRRQFTAASDIEPTIEFGHLIESPAGKVTSYYWSKWQAGLGKPLLVAYGTNPKLIREHPMPEKTCVAPEPALQLLRQEDVIIGSQSYPAAVIKTHDDEATMTAWNALTPGLACLELKA